jgi:hypothetical protein
MQLRAQLATRPRSFFALTDLLESSLRALSNRNIDADVPSYLDCLVAGTY